MTSLREAGRPSNEDTLDRRLRGVNDSRGNQLSLGNSGVHLAPAPAPPSPPSH